MTRKAISGGNKRSGATGTWAKIKYDRQIIAIAKVSRADTIYTDDENLRTFAEAANIKIVRLADIPLPPETAQETFPDFQPENNNENQEPNEAENAETEE